MSAPSPLEHHGDHSVGRRDRQQVHRGGFDGNQQRAISQHEQEECEADDPEDEPRSALSDKFRQIDVERRDTAHVTTHATAGFKRRKYAVAQVEHECLGARITRSPFGCDTHGGDTTIGAHYGCVNAYYSGGLLEGLAQRHESRILGPRIAPGGRVGGLQPDPAAGDRGGPAGRLRRR